MSQPATINFTLSVKGDTVTLDVTSAADTLNTTDATIGNSVSNATIEALPLIDRNVEGLLALQPGVLYLGASNDQKLDSRSGVVSGARSDQSNLTLDGLDNNDQVNGYAFTGVLRSTLDSVEEFRVTTSNANADSGRSSGGQVNLVTKSGTNTYHGSLYEYNRSSIGNANDWFNKQAQLASGSPNSPGKYVRNTFGGTFGAPIKKDKLFFFANYEASRIATNVQVTQTVPTTLMQQGNVQYTAADGSNVTLTPSQIATMDPNCAGNGTCPWGPGNDPNALAVLNQFPASNGFNAGDGLNSGSYTFSAPNPVSLNTMIAKLDFTPVTAQHVFVRGNLQNDSLSGAPQFPGEAASSRTRDNTKGIAAGDTWSISNTIVNNLRFGFIREGYGASGVGSGAYTDFRGFSTLQAENRSSIISVPVENVVDDFSWTKGKHTVEIGGNFRLINNNRSSNALSFSSATTNPSWFAATKIAGSGGSFDPAAFGFKAVDPHFGNSYDLAISALAGLVSQVTTQNNYKVSKDGASGSLLSQGTFVNRDFKANEFESYAQDTWQARPNLTITLGVRYTLLQTPYEANGQQVQPTIDFHNWFETRSKQAAVGVSDQPAITFAPSGKARGGKPYWAMNKLDFAPRFSVAYSPSSSDGFFHRLFGGAGKSSIRAGYGMYYDHFGQGIVNSFDKLGSFSLTSSLQNAAGSLTPDTTPRFTGLHDVPNLTGVATSSISYPQTPSNDPFGAGFAITYGLDDHIKTPYSHVFDASLQRELPGGFTLEADYIGRFGRHLLQQMDLAQPLNLFDPTSKTDYYTAATQMSKYVDQGLTTIPTVPYFDNLFPAEAGGGNTASQNIYNNLWVYVRGNETSGLSYLDVYGAQNAGTGLNGGDPLGRFWPLQYSSLYAWVSNGSSSYNAGQITLRHSATHGLQTDLNYTLSKSIDLGSDAERTTSIGGTGFTAILDAWNPKKNRGVSDFNTAHLFTGDFVYQLPFGQGKKFAGGANRLVDAIIGGWQLSGIGRVSSGLPFSVISGAGWATNWNLRSAMVRTGPIGIHRHLTNGQEQVFTDPAKALANMRNPYPGEAGQRNNFIGDGYFDIDSGLSKSWRLYESHTLKFAWETFNVTNSARFDTNPNTSLNTFTASGTFGVYGATLTQSRKMQFSLRYDF